VHWLVVPVKDAADGSPDVSWWPEDALRRRRTRRSDLSGCCQGVEALVKYFTDARPFFADHEDRPQAGIEG
jgi:hypothetical protein